MTDLSSVLFVNTRPTDRAVALSDLLEREGCRVFELPLLELRQCEYSPALEGLFHTLNDVQCIVVVSPTAVTTGMQYLKESGLFLEKLQHVQWIAVGQTTADCLAEYGIQAHVPKVETSEGMLSLPIFTEQNNLKKIAFWRGEGGRQFMMQHCIAQQIEVLNFVLYTRALPETSWNHFKKISSELAKTETYEQRWVCISSEASWKNWKLLCGDLNIFKQMNYLVLGPRLNEILQLDRKEQQLCFKIMQVEQLNPKVILRTLVEYKSKS